jgi:type VI secretion system protein ImpA
MSAVAEEITIEFLLEPIPGDHPTGENLQYSGLHDEIREARRSEENLEQGEWKRDTKSADWHQVEDLAKEALATKTKDLQVTVWLVEALVKLHGLTGLQDGLKLASGLLERYWESLYPEIDEGDLEARANAFAWLDRQLAVAVKEVLVTKTPSGLNYNFFQFEEAKQFNIPEKLDELSIQELEQVNELKQRAEKDGKITSEHWRTAKGVTRRAFYEDLYKQIGECWQEFQTLDRVMDEKFQRQTPGMGFLKKALDEVRSEIEKIVKEKRIAEPDQVSPTETAEGGEEVLSAGGTTIIRRSGPVRSREDALKQLSEVAEYFQKTEPHSPVSYLVQRAIRWGEMPLELWLEEVVKNEGVLDQLRETLGLKGAAASGAKGT